jgi:hypothetical protein
MIRPATFTDIPAMTELLRSAHKRSKYAGRTGLNEKAMEQLFVAMVAAQNQNGPQASFCVVAEKGEKVTGFMCGALNRIYNVGEKLGASDLFLINDGRNSRDTLAMIDAYIEWAQRNPKVIEIGLSWSDAVHEGGIAEVYKRKGFSLIGEQYSLRLDQSKREAA